MSTTSEPQPHTRASGGRRRTRRTGCTRPTGRNLRARGFRRDESGTTVIEFAILAMPFLLVIFSILEMSLAFFAERVLQDGLMEAKRKVRLGEITSEGAFRRELCSAAAVPVLFDCGRISISIERVPNGGRAPEPPRNNKGEIDLGQLAFAPGPRESTNIARVFYHWPRFLPVGMTSGGAYVRKSDKTLLEGAAVFNIEP